MPAVFFPFSDTETPTRAAPPRLTALIKEAQQSSFSTECKCKELFVHHSTSPTLQSTYEDMDITSTQRSQLLIQEDGLKWKLRKSYKWYELCDRHTLHTYADNQITKN